jgi:hypothetical protein
MGSCNSFQRTRRSFWGNMTNAWGHRQQANHAAQNVHATHRQILVLLGILGIVGEAALGQLPDLDQAILRGRGNHIVCPRTSAHGSEETPPSILFFFSKTPQLPSKE